MNASILYDYTFPQEVLGLALQSLTICVLPKAFFGSFFKLDIQVFKKWPRVSTCFYVASMLYQRQAPLMTYQDVHPEYT